MARLSLSFFRRTEHVETIRQEGQNQVRVCQQCRQRVSILPLELAAKLANVDIDEIADWVDSGRVHMIGRFVCARSLIFHR